jgi:hypothetical protein
MLHSPMRSTRKMHVFQNQLHVLRSFRASRFVLAVCIRRQQRIVVNICKLHSVSTIVYGKMSTGLGRRRDANCTGSLLA